MRSATKIFALLRLGRSPNTNKLRKVVRNIKIAASDGTVIVDVLPPDVHGGDRDKLFVGHF